MKSIFRLFILFYFSFISSNLYANDITIQGTASTAHKLTIGSVGSNDWGFSEAFVSANSKDIFTLNNSDEKEIPISVGNKINLNVHSSKVEGILSLDSSCLSENLKIIEQKDYILYFELQPDNKVHCLFE